MNERLKLSDGERSTLGEIGHRLGCTALAEVATVAKPDAILAWYRKLVAHRFDELRLIGVRPDAGQRARYLLASPRRLAAAASALEEDAPPF